jgi:hypothetical protein
MTKLTVAKRVPMVILLGKVAVIQAVPATLKALEPIYPGNKMFSRMTC